MIISEQLDYYFSKLGVSKNSESSIPHSSKHTFLKKIRLKNIRCFEDITLDLNVESFNGGSNEPSLRTVLVGDNATGKSTLLRACALGIADESSAIALLKAMNGKMIRAGTDKGLIELTLHRKGAIRSMKLSTEIVVSQSGAEILRKKPEKKSDILVVGYGTQRARAGTQSHQKYDIVNAVGTLFDENATLQNPELVLLRQPTYVREEMGKVLAGILELDSGQIEYGSDAVRIAGPWGNQSLEVLSDGYRSTTQWLLDFVNWLVFFNGADTNLDETSAIILIDELEQHLHPHWQRKIISRLRDYLPKRSIYHN